MIKLIRSAIAVALTLVMRRSVLVGMIVELWDYIMCKMFCEIQPV